MDAELEKQVKDILFDKDKYKNFMGRINQSIGKKCQYWSFWIYRERDSF